MTVETILVKFTLNINEMSNSSSITGTIITQSGGPLPGAVVSVESQNTEGNHTTVSNQKGKFLIRDLSPGPFMLTATATGFMDSKKSGSLKIDEDLPVHITMYNED